jgi:hypothetical protein
MERAHDQEGPTIFVRINLLIDMIVSVEPRDRPDGGYDPSGLRFLCDTHCDFLHV